jgi:hypothetical protein
MRALTLSLCACLVMVNLSLAQESPAGTIATVNPLGFLQFGPTAEVEFDAGSAASLALGARLPNLGLLSHVVDSEIGFSWTAMASVRFYLDSARKPAGWYVAPRAEVGKSRSGGESYTLKGGALEAAHRWLFANGRNLSLGAMAGKFQSSSDLEGWFVMGVLNVGVGGRR